MTYSNAAYWQAEVNRCKQFADEGACLARISRRVPVTIVPGFGNYEALGQTDSLAALAARSAELVALQTALMSAGVLNIRTADGVIGSSTSPTLAAVRTWATSHGLSATGTARTASGGLAIPAALLASITGAPGGASGGSSTKTGSEPAPASAVLPGFTSEGGSVATWMPWAGSGMYLLGGGAALVLVGVFLLSRR